MMRTYRYRAYPNRKTEDALWRAFEDYAKPWCNALAERHRRSDAFQRVLEPALEAERDAQGRELTERESKAVVHRIGQVHGGPITTYKGQQYQHVRKREHPEFSRYDAQSLQQVLIKLDGSWKSWQAL